MRRRMKTVITTSAPHAAASHPFHAYGNAINGMSKRMIPIAKSVFRCVCMGTVYRRYWTSQKKKRGVLWNKKHPRRREFLHRQGETDETTRFPERCHHPVPNHTEQDVREEEHSSAWPRPHRRKKAAYRHPPRRSRRHDRRSAT